MRTLLLLLFAVSIFGEEFAGENVGVQLWNNLSVTLNVVDKQDGQKKYTVTFRKNKKRILVKQYEYSSLEFAGFYKTKQNEFLHLSGYTGGESGCCSVDEFFYVMGSTVKSFVVEHLEYNPLIIADVDNDGDEEITGYGELYYGNDMRSPFDSNGDSCTIRMPGLYQNGFHEVVFPVYSKPVRNNVGEYILEEVTFQAQYRKALEPYLRKAEASLERHRGQVYSSGDYFHGYMQYVYYMEKIGQKASALKKIEDSRIKLSFDCPGSAVRREVSLGEFIKMNEL